MTCQEWLNSGLDRVRHRKSKLVSDLDIDQPLFEALSRMQEGLNFIGLVTKDRTQLHATIYNTDVINFITTHWTADSSIFREPVKNLDFF